MRLYTFSIFAFHAIYQYRLEQISYNFPQIPVSYIGEVLDLPQQKPRSVACEVQLTYPVDKKIMLYLHSDSNSQTLVPGDELLVSVEVQPFKNLGNPDDFDYVGFMQNKGFSGSAYANSLSWLKTGRQSSSIKAKALRVRARCLMCIRFWFGSRCLFIYLSNNIRLQGRFV